MKVRVENIEFNPFRNINLVPIDLITVEKLKDSIGDLGLWAGMTARPKNNDWDSGKYEIPFGHHRLVAIREMGIEEIDIAVNEISDFNMVLMMVQENMTQRGVSVEMIHGTVREVKEFLDGELAKYESWEALNDSIKSLFETEWDLKNVKGKGVGQTTILKFLKNSIPQWRIAEALDLIKSNDIDSEVLPILETTGAVAGFKKAIRKINEEKEQKGEPGIDISAQKQLAQKVKESKSTGRTGGGNYYKSMEDIIRQEIDGEDDFANALNSAARKLKAVQEETTKLASKIGELNSLLNSVGVTEMRSIASIISISEFTTLLLNISTLADYLGIKKQLIP